MPRKRRPGRPTKAQAFAKKMAAMGNPMPLTAKDKAKKAQLMAKWYDKLRNKGFTDLEWLDDETGLGQNTPHLKNPGSVPTVQEYRGGQDGSLSSLDQPYRPTVYEHDAFYYRMWTNYLAHNRVRKKPRKGQRIGTIDYEAELVCRLYSEGLSYREIMREINKRRGSRRTVFYIWYVLDRFRAEMQAFNEHHPEGLLHPRNREAYLREQELKYDWSDEQH